MRLIILVFFCLTTATGFSQTEISGIIKDAHSGTSIPYANVYLKNHAVGTTAFRDGSFKLKLDSVFQDSVIIAIIGYGKQSLFLPDAVQDKSLNVKLEPKQEALMEVEVKPRKMKSYEAGLAARRSKHCSGQHRKHAYARLIPNESKLQGFVNSVAVYVCREGIYNAPFRVNLLSVDFKSGQPSEPLISKDYIVHAVEGNEWVEIDLRQQLVKFPEEGFFVSLSVLPIDSFQMDEYRERLSDYTDRQISYSAPVFGHSYESYAESSEYNWQKGWIHDGWVSYWREVYQGRDTLYPSSFQFNGNVSASSLMIKAEINYYADQKLKVKELKTKRKVKKVFDRPKENTLKYPQSSPSDLMSSLKKAIDNDDFAYMCNYLLYYHDKSELEQTMAFVETKKTGADIVIFTEKEKGDMINVLTDLKSSLNDLKSTEEDRFAFELEYEGAVYYFQNKNGAWKINPRSTRMLNPEMKIPTNF